MTGEMPPDPRSPLDTCYDERSDRLMTYTMDVSGPFLNLDLCDLYLHSTGYVFFIRNSLNLLLYSPFTWLRYQMS